MADWRHRGGASADPFICGIEKYEQEGLFVKEDDSYSSGNRKLNCWEFKKCGRELGGENASELGVCPATTNPQLDSVHDGMSAGRGCWVVAGTLCEGTVHGTFAQKYRTCGQCDFYEYVKSEEGEDHIPTMTLLKMLE